ncbi:hypothetical protein BGW36DRAFT_362837 [Talaromyces proteolyticus]|uniref:J domain-containing protein n=1 Tax=Talaromyces proteolyticus TaxID=1131652 RepID=A0AAD4KHB6_9EURO|nr:uncharacterized protein BGW36DRAFT_362837 [Talaromyces proteolyticus]KAH8691800.1 hypothetical protein BGW36DRAFT_362837 [Talaromyces proteolyticus]
MGKPDASKDYYATLHVEPGATQDEIRQQYKKLALAYHPDRNRGRETEFVAKFQAIQEANETLSDERLRQLYDIERFQTRFTSSTTQKSTTSFTRRGAQPTSNTEKPSYTSRRWSQFDTTKNPFSPPPGRGRYGGQEYTRWGTRTPAFERSRTTKKTGFNPGVSGDDEPRARKTTSYTNTRHSDRPRNFFGNVPLSKTKAGTVPGSFTPPPPEVPEPKRAKRGYATTGGEKTFFSSAELPGQLGTQGARGGNANTPPDIPSRKNDKEGEYAKFPSTQSPFSTNNQPQPSQTFPTVGNPNESQKFPGGKIPSTAGINNYRQPTVSTEEEENETTIVPPYHEGGRPDPMDGLPTTPTDIPAGNSHTEKGGPDETPFTAPRSNTSQQPGQSQNFGLPSPPQLPTRPSFILAENGLNGIVPPIETYVESICVYIREWSCFQRKMLDRLSCINSGGEPGAVHDEYERNCSHWRHALVLYQQCILQLGEVREWIRSNDASTI